MEEPVFDKYADTYDSWFKTPLGKKVYVIEKRCVEELIPDGRGKRALDLGIGTGLFTLLLKEKGFDVVGVDISEKMMEVARKRGFKTIKHDFNYPLPFEDEEFDFIFSMTAIEFLRNPKNLVEESFRVLKRGGEFLLVALNSLSLWAFIRRINGVFKKEYVFKKAKFYSPNALERLFGDGWKIVVKKTCMFLPPWNTNNINFWERRFKKIFKNSGALSIILAKKEVAHGD